jgi:adenine phosphoribosyltransferase
VPTRPDPAVDPTLAAEVTAVLRDVPDFPRAGVLFRDITPLLARPGLFGRVTNAMADRYAGIGVTQVAAVESRGFIFGAPVAQRLGAAFVPVRKPGKLPARVERHEYALEYGTDALEIHADACPAPAVVLIVDDVLATGGTAHAAAQLVQRLGGEIAGYSFLLEIAVLGGRAALGGAAPVATVVSL